MLDDAVEVKSCARCGTAKPLNCFHRHHSCPDGFRNTCKSCRKAMEAAYLSSSEYKEKRRSYLSKPEVRARNGSLRKNPSRLNKKREYDSSRKVLDRKAHLRSTPEAKRARREYNKSYNAQPHVKAREAERWQRKMSCPRYSARRRVAVMAYKKSQAGRASIVRCDARRRSKKASMATNWTCMHQRAALLIWDSKCVACRRELPSISDVTWDHWIPVSAPHCPGTVPSNMVPMCLSCNSSKGARDAHAWLLSRFGTAGEHIYAAVSEILSEVDENAG